MARSTLSIEHHSIDVIPADERKGSPSSQLTLWLGANLQITAIVDGALAVVFGADALWAIIGLLIGNLAGGAVMALHSAQGPRLGLPQMISSRAQFGVYGAVVPLLLVIVMYLGFTATGTVLSGQAINALLGVDAPIIGIGIFIVLVGVIATIGHDLIHVVGRVASVLGVIGFGYLAVRLFTEHDVSAAVANPSFDIVTFLLAVALAAGWQLTFGPYVADYSRYLPEATPERTVFAATYWGTVLGSQVAMTFGAVVAAVAGDAFLDQPGRVAWRPGRHRFPRRGDLRADRGRQADRDLPQRLRQFMCTATTVTAFTGARSMGRTARTVFVALMLLVAGAIALLASANFLETSATSCSCC